MEELYPIGLGTGRFPFRGAETYKEDFEAAVNLVLYALDHGVNYIDVAKGYSSGYAYSVLKEAFKRTDRQYNVTVKINVYDPHTTNEEYYNEALSILDQMGLRKASHFLMWTLMDPEQFERATAPGGLYEVALRLKQEGRIDHIGASLHMQKDEIINVINSGLVEFVLISCNLINLLDMLPVLDLAKEKNVDVFVMNPLYGGLIPQNAKMFEYAKLYSDESVVQAAVRALLAHPAVKCVLAGASNIDQLDDYLKAAEDRFLTENKEERLQLLKTKLESSPTFCSFCRYCIDCPKKIPVPQLMNARNIFVLQDGLSEKQAIANYFKVLHEKFDLSFESGENPCIHCGKCERRCTQHLPIIKSVDEIYTMIRKAGYDKESRRRRFDELINGKGYKIIGFWPASAGTKKIIDIYKDLFGEPDFDIILFDSNKELRGKEAFGYPVFNKEDVVNEKPDCILITSFKYGEVIKNQIQDLSDNGIDLKVLYREDDADWLW